MSFPFSQNEKDLFLFLAERSGESWSSRNLMNHCMLTGNLDGIKWLREIGYSWNIVTLEFSVIAGHLHVIRWAIRDGCPCGPSIVKHALRQRKTDVLEVMLQCGIPWYKCVSKIADRCKDLKTRKWLREHGYDILSRFSKT